MQSGQISGQYHLAKAGQPSMISPEGLGSRIRITQLKPGHPKNPIVCNEPQHYDTYKLHLGNYISIGLGVKIFLSGNHNTNRVTTYLNPYLSEDTSGMLSNGDVWIGNDVWIGDDVTIMSGVKIGDGAVIATGSIVTKNVPAYTIVGGTPAKTLKKRFSKDIIDRLKAVKWWSLPEEVILQHQHLIWSENVEEFLEEIETYLKK